MKKPWIVIITLIVLAGAAIGWTFRGKKLGGAVVDCLSNQPIAGADVAIRLPVITLGQHVFYARSLTAQSDRAGAFEFAYRLGQTASVRVKKKGFVTAEQTNEPTTGLVVRLRTGDKPQEVTYNCRLSSECIHRSFENDVWVYTDVCVH